MEKKIIIFQKLRDNDQDRWQSRKCMLPHACVKFISIKKPMSNCRLHKILIYWVQCLFFFFMCHSVSVFSRFSVELLLLWNIILAKIITVHQITRSDGILVNNQISLLLEPGWPAQSDHMWVWQCIRSLALQVTASEKCMNLRLE